MTPRAIGLLGCGAMGRYLAAQLRNDPGVVLARAWDPLSDACNAMAPLLNTDARVELPELWGETVTLLVEAAHPTVVPEALGLAVANRWHLLIASVGGLVSPEGHAALTAALLAGIAVHIPAGAIGGIDLLSAIPRSELNSVTLRTRKPPQALPPEEARGLKKATCLFEGSAREAIARFPKNVNVAVTLSLAGMGVDATRVEVWGDPTITQNTHEIEIESGVGHYLFRCANEPLAENPGTSRLAALSMLAVIRGKTTGLLL
ncbi:MAG: aspartate dehydrogenase domain-containing protein [bacterium]